MHPMYEGCTAIRFLLWDDLLAHLEILSERIQQGSSAIAHRTRTAYNLKDGRWVDLN